MDRNNRWMVFVVLLFALVRGLLYASFLPPWGLVDEEQHFDYIEQLSERQSVPIANRTFLSPDIIQSLFETKRWDKFHWSQPSSANPAEMGLEGYSYEGYQPPFFYLASIPIYLALPDAILVKLYGLRWTMVLASLTTVWITLRLSAELFPQSTALPYMIGLALAAIPERTISTSRLNNDVLLELLAAAFVWMSTRSILNALTIRRSVLLGIFLGFGILTKISMLALAPALLFVFWVNRHDPRLLSKLFIVLLTLAILVVPWCIYNFGVYGDWSGFASFDKLNQVLGVFHKPPLSPATFIGALWDLYRNLWAIWWNGSEVGFNPILGVFYAILAIISVNSLSQVGRFLYSNRSDWRIDKQYVVLGMYGFLSAISAAVVVKGYFDGTYPVIQGRFMLPVILPLVILLVWGIWQSSYRRELFALMLGTLLALDATVLFGKLLPYFYYWSAFFKNGQPLPYVWQGWQSAWDIFSSRLLSDKPVEMYPLLALLVPMYLATLFVVGKTLAADLRNQVPVKL